MTEIIINGERVDFKPEEIGISISYKHEDIENFQKKTSDQAFNIKLPFTKANQRISNSYQDPSQDDLTPGQVNRNPKNAVITSNGIELLVGKAFLINGSEKGYEYSFYGGNGDWIVDLKDKTLFDFLSQIVIPFTKGNIESSWNFNGLDESLPYVFAPIKFGSKMDVFTESDANVDPTYLKPSLSVYWIIYWAFKSLGYIVKSNFFDTPYFRRLVMPWTWGSFLNSDGTKLQVHKFLAKTAGEDVWIENFTGTADLSVSNDSTDGAYDNNDDYSYVNRQMVWQYKAPYFGLLDATFSCQVQYNTSLVGSNSFCHYVIRWSHYKASTASTTLFKEERIVWGNGHNLTHTDIVGIDTFYATRTIDNGDKIMCSMYIDIHAGKGVGAHAWIQTGVIAIQLEYFRIPLGGTINFNNYTGFQKHKFLDFFGGVCDLFDLSFITDTENKTVTIEPSHNYALVGNDNKSGGFFTGNRLDWSDKKDVSVDWKLDLYSDFEREMVFQFREDSADGIVKILQDRNITVLSRGKYLFPERFKSGIKEYTNRFFSAVAHYNCEQFKSITGHAPQLICIVPENISNTSNSEAGNTFNPKIVYYKGQVSNNGGWKYDGVVKSTIPFMFAVNYNYGGELDPILSYSDERTTEGIIGQGLLKRFFWQRLAIIRNGQFLNSAYLRLTHDDVTRPQRDYKIIDGIIYELIEISGYKPLKDDTTPCILRKWVPISHEDYVNTFPSMVTTPITGYDIKYVPAIALTSDIQ